MPPKIAMKIIDMHLNPVIQPDLHQIGAASLDDLKASCQHFESAMIAEDIAHAIMVVTNPDMLEETGAVDAVASAQESGKLTIAAVQDFRHPDAVERLERMQARGVRVLKYHPYMQRIESRDFDRARQLASHAEALGMWIMICGAHGTRALDRYSGTRLAAYVSEKVSCPIVLSHGGGANVIDAMLVAEEASNLILDTSFSIPYFANSSIDQDFAFAIRKLGAKRWVYGSDAPFCGLQDALSKTRSFLERHRFTDPEVESVLFHTAAEILEIT